MSIKDGYDELVGKLKTERDELNVRVHLAGAEIRDEWQVLEDRLDQLKLKSEHLRDASSESAEGLSLAGQELVRELKESYQRIRGSLR